MAARRPTGVGFSVFFEIVLQERLAVLDSAVAMPAAGSFWSLVWEGAGSVARTQEVDIGRPLRVRRILDDLAEHCATCPPKEQTYDSWEDMLAVTGGVPADGSDDCHSNCRCHLEFEDPDTGEFKAVFQ